MTKKTLDVTTEEQTKLWTEAHEGAVHSCETCRNYAALREPFVRSDEAVIYGYCFRYGDKDYNWGMGKGYPVFMPSDVDVPCDGWKKRKKEADA